MALKPAQPAILIAHTRSGGTFLAHCLSNHPDIFCPRGEPLKMWHGHIPGTKQTQALAIALHAYHYKVSMCRLTDVQTSIAIYDYLRRVEAKIVLLERRNLLRCAVSQTLMNMVNRGELKRPIHTTTTIKPVPVTLSPQAVLERCRWQQEWHERVRQDVAETRLPVLHLTYARVTGGEMVSAERVSLRETERICSFLGVEHLPLTASLRAVSPFSLKALVANWDNLEEAVQDSEFAHFLKEEVE